MQSEGRRGPRAAAQSRTKIGSWDDLRQQVATIVERINADGSLALAAAANPLLALEELGYEIDPAVRPEIEERVRFHPPEAKRLGELRRELSKQAGGAFDPASDDDVKRVLGELGVKVGRLPATPRERPPIRVRGKGEQSPVAEDPFERLRGKHDLIEPLLEYRRLERAEPGLASREVYAAVRDGRRKVPVTRLRAVVKSDRDRRPKR